MRVPTSVTPRTQRASGETPFVRNTRGAATQSSAALGNQLIAAGNTIGSVGGLFRQQAEQAKRFGVMQNFSAFTATVDQQLAEMKRNADPAQGNFADVATATYSNWEADWLKSVPDEFYDEFATRAADIKARVARDAMAFQYERTDEYFRQGMNDLLETSLPFLDQDGSVANLAARKAEFDERLSATTLTEAEQISLRRQGYVKMESAAYKAEMRRGNIQAASLGVGSAPGEAVDLLLEFDGASLENGLDYETNRELLGERVKEAEAAAVAGIGSAERWGMIPSHARGAIISVVDDLGGMPEELKIAIDSGDLETVASVIANLGGDEERRAVEARIILGLEGTPEGFAEADPRFANIPYEDRLSLRADAEREAASIQTAEQKAAIAAQKASINELEVGLMDGKFGQYEIDQAREDGWLTDAADIKRLQKVLEDEVSGLRATQMIQGLINSGQTGNSADEDFRKAFNAYVGTEGEDALRQRDPAYVRDVLIPATRTLGDLPTDTVGLLGTMTRAQDPAQALFALDTLSQLEQASPEAYIARVPEAIRGDVNYWRSIKDFYPQDEVLSSVRGGTTQEERTRVKMLQDEARELIGTGKLPEALFSSNKVEILTRFDPTGELARGGWLTSDAITVAGVDRALDRDYQELFITEYARDGNAKAAKDRATDMLQTLWKVTDLGGQRQLMRYPPELVGYQTWNNSYDWITAQGLEVLRENAPNRTIETFQLISDEQTRSEFQAWQSGNGAPPSYVVAYTDENGQLRGPTRQNRGAGGEQFDTGVPMRLNFEITPEMDAQKGAQLATVTSNQENERFMVTYNMALTHSLATGVPIPAEIQDEYNRRIEMMEQ